MDLTDAQKQELMTAGLNLIGQALTVYDADLRLSICNAPFQKMFDLPPELTTPGARFEDTIRHLARRGEYGSLDDPEVFVAQRVQQARAFEAHYMERTRSNGRTISVEGSPLPQGGWITVYTDITRTKGIEALLRARSDALSEKLVTHAEELSAANRELAATNLALEEAKRQLTEMERQTRLTTEMMPAHIAHVDAAGRYTYSNRRLSTVIPGSPSEIVGQTMEAVLGARNFQRIAPHLAATYEGESPVFEFTDDRASRRIRVALTPDQAGGAYILSTDVTAEAQARAALQQSRRRATGAQLTSGLAHDFSNLLTIILGLQGKLARLELPEEVQTLVTATQTAARRGGRLLNRLGDMTGNRTLRPRATDMRALLEDLKVLATPSLPQATGLSVLDHVPEGAVMLDPGMVQDALLNLVLNARDACGSSGQIVVSVHVVGGTWLELTVTDTGPGFSDEALEKGFEPFFTTKGGEGSGLGLAMVYDMVKLGGGDVKLANTGTGASVSIRLPYRPAPPATGGLALLVEDSEELRPAIRDMLMGLGFLVIEAVSADEAAALAADLPGIALVLSDLRLEGQGTGLDVIDRVSAAGGPPVILMTSLPPEDPLHQQALTRAAVLRKPFKAEDLARLTRPEAAE